MSDFPKDVWLAAIAALDGHGEIRIIEVIAGAILTERERCAEMAEDLQLMGKDGYEISSAIRGTS